MGKVPVAQSVLELIEPVLMANGLELVDVEFKKEGKKWVLRIYIDKKSGVTLADCQKVSGHAGALAIIDGCGDRPPRAPVVLGDSMKFLVLRRWC